MAQRKAGLRQIRVDKKRRMVNLKTKNDLKKNLKKLEKLIVAKDAQKAKVQFVIVSSRLDKASKRGYLHKNTASRKKSRLSIRINKIA